MQSGFDPPPPPQNPPPPGYPASPPGNGGGPGYPGGPGNPSGPPGYGNPYAPYAQQPQIQMPPTFGYSPSPYGYGYAAPTEGKAVTALVLGIVSIFCFGIFAGIPAIILGVLSKKAIDRSAGTLGGSGFAVGGIVTGGIGSLMSVATIGLFVASAVGAARAASSIATGPYPTAMPTFTIPTPPTPTATGPVASTETHGTISEISLGVGRPLQDQLIDLRADAIADGRTPIVVSTAPWCGACKEVESTLDEPEMQKALANVTLLMVDIDEFGPQMDALKMSTNAVPSFFKIDSNAHATDAITGDEWDANTAENEAPVLGPFAKGTLKKRRHPPTTGTSL